MRQTHMEENQSCLAVERGKQPKLSSKIIIEVKDRWVKARVTMDTGAAGHVMLEGMFPLVKFERKTAPKKFVAADGEHIRDSGDKTMPSKKHMRRFKVVVVRAGNTVVLDEETPHIRNARDRTMIKLDVNSGVYTVDV